MNLAKPITFINAGGFSAGELLVGELLEICINVASLPKTGHTDNQQQITNNRMARKPTSGTSELPCRASIT